MRRLYLLPALFVFGVFSLLGTQEARAACTLETGPAQTNAVESYETQYGISSGSWIDVYAKAYQIPEDCGTYRTNLVPNPYLTDDPSESNNVSSTSSRTYGSANIPIIAQASATASNSTFSISSHINEEDHPNTWVIAKPDVVDLLYFDYPDYDGTNAVTVDVEFCSTYSTSSGYTETGTNNATLSAGGNSWTTPGALNKITHTSASEVCQDGEITIDSTLKTSSWRLTSSVGGSVDYEDVVYSAPWTVRVYSMNGSIDAHGGIGALPTGVTCYSGSGSFPGCERLPPASLVDIAGVDPSKDDGGYGRTFGNVNAMCTNSFAAGGPDAFAANDEYGNPINIALGYKTQREADYAGGGLSFTRIYRSDSTWTSDVMGKYWRHNFDRVFNILSSPLADNDSIDITDASGAMSIFREDSSGDWDAIDEDIKTTLENTFDGSTHDGYLYTTNDDTREYYDLDGLLYRIEYRGSEALDLAYDVSDRLDTVTNQHGKELEFNYNGSDQVSSVVTPTGTYSYTYDSNDNLSTVTKPDTEVRTYHYEDTSFVNALTGITDEENVRFATWAYDSEGRATSSKHYGDVAEHTVAYNSDGTVTTTNPLGKETIYTFETIHGSRKMVDVDGQASTNCPAAGKTFAYDSNGFVSSKTDWLGNTTTIQRDNRGYVTSFTEDAYGSDYRTTTITYDSTFRLPDVISETGKTTDYDYDSDGRVTTITVTDTGTSEVRTWTYSYNSNTTDSNGNTVLGKLSSVNGPRTDVTDTTSYTYDSSLRLTKVSNALSHETEITSFDSANRPLTIDDANDVETKLVYDSSDRLTSSTRAFGTSLAATTSYTYDDNGNVLTITDPTGVVITYTYDGAHRLTGIEDDLGNTITYTLDDDGNITKEEYKNTSSTLKYTHSYVFDELSRLLESVDANLDATDYAYDVNSNLTSITDANSNATSFAFDGLDRLVQATDALSGVTSYDINEHDQLEGVDDPRSNETTYSYNAFGDVTQEVSPDRGTITYTHDKAGNIKSMTDARSVVTNYTYDAINRLTDVEYPSDSSLDVTLIHDSTTGCGTAKGRLCSVVDASGTTDYVYDDLGRLTSVTETRGALSFATSYAYDASGVLTKITLPSGRDIDYTLNGNGQVSAVAADINSTSTTLANSITYKPFGPMASLTYGNSVTLTNTHNTAYQLTNRSIGSLMYDNFTYDDAQFITAKGSDSYTLDNLYRITADGSDSYTYDAIGNRTAKNSDTYVYPSTSSKLSSIASVSLTHDAAGNLTADTQRTYTIDAAGRVKEVKISGSTVGEYVYDADNLRTKKTASSVVTHYVYGMGGKLYGEYDASGNMLVEYVYLNGKPLAQIDDVSSSDVLLYLHTDHQGTPRYATNTSGSQVWAWSSDAFGVGIPTGSATINIRFPGQYFDDESDLHYNWNRYYDPETGRYITSDPIGLAGGLNTFGYANANPVMFIDPEGLSGEVLSQGGSMGQAVGDVAARAATAVATRTPVGVATIGVVAVGEACRPGIEAAGHAAGRGLRNLIDWANSTAEEGDTDDEKEPVPLPENIVGDNPRPKKGRVNTDAPAEDFPGIIEDLTGGDLTEDDNGNKVSPNGVRVRKGKDGTPRIDIPANGDKPHETIHPSPSDPDASAETSTEE